MWTETHMEQKLWKLHKETQTSLRFAGAVEKVTVIINGTFDNKDRVHYCDAVRVHVCLRHEHGPASRTRCCTSWWNTDTPDRKQIMSTQKLGDRHKAVAL